MDRQAPLYEDRFGAIERWVQRLRRFVRWRTRRGLGKPVGILVEIRWRLGDEIMALPIYEGLKTFYPHSRLTVWCNYPDLLRDNPHVDAVNDETVRPDKYILLQGAPRHAVRIEHYARKAGIPVPADPPRVRYADWSTSLLDGIAREGQPLVALCTGASWTTKRWPLERWRELAQRLVDAGCAVVQIGYGDERIRTVPSLVDQTSPGEAACVLRATSLFISGDTGPMHLARAVGTTTLSLFGPTLARILADEDPDWAIITNGRDCHGCWNLRKDRIREGVCPLDIPVCLDPISVDAVFDRAMELLARGTR